VLSAVNTKSHSLKDLYLDIIADDYLIKVSFPRHLILNIKESIVYAANMPRPPLTFEYTVDGSVKG